MAKTKTAKPAPLDLTLPWQVLEGDCLAQFPRLPAESVDLVIVDPPYDIGYEYPEFDDTPDEPAYLAWLARVFAAVHRALKPDGTFWLIIGDERAAQAKLIAEQHPWLDARRVPLFPGFYTRSWVLWYYTFGVACTQNFARSHTHLFCFTKSRERFTFNAAAAGLRVPSARQLLYNDKRANPAGKLPDNTWILSPLDLAKAFTPDEDTWCISRVCGTYRERCDRGTEGERKGVPQLPLALVDRLVLASSRPGELVLDCMCGTGTTGVSAVRLGRRFLGIDLGATCVKMSRERISEAAQQGGMTCVPSGSTAATTPVKTRRRSSRPAPPTPPN